MKTSIQQRVMAENAQQRIQSNVMHLAHHIYRTLDCSWREPRGVGRGGVPPRTQPMRGRATNGGKYAAEGENEKLGRHTMPG